jgi:thiopurine S-methyltransferase
MTHPQFWIDRWHNGQTGWHKSDIHISLLEFWNRALADTKTVFVPLCGASLDMRWLREQGCHVIGVEVSAVAIERFFTEAKLSYELTQQGNLGIYSGNGYTLICGDFFDLTKEILKDVDAVYDRASLIALPQDKRQHYVEHIKSILPLTAQTMLITLEYPQEEMSGPPFSVHEQEVKTLYAQVYEVILLGREDIIKQEPHMQKKGLSALAECAYLLKPC